MMIRVFLLVRVMKIWFSDMLNFGEFCCKMVLCLKLCVLIKVLMWLCKFLWDSVIFLGILEVLFVKRIVVRLFVWVEGGC